MTTGFTVIEEIATRTPGRRPLFQVQDAAQSASGAPPNGDNGVNVENAIVSLSALSPRRNASAFTSRITVDTFDLLLGVYTVTVNGNAVNYDASVALPADNAAFLAGLATAINDDVTVGGLVSAAVSDLNGDGIADGITLTNLGAVDATHTTQVGVVGGTGELSFVEDAVSFDATLWLLFDTSLTASLVIPWCRVNAASYTGIDYRGFAERFETSGALRVYWQIENIVGPGSPSPSVQIVVATGPGERE